MNTIEIERNRTDLKLTVRVNGLKVIECASLFMAKSYAEVIVTAFEAAKVPYVKKGF